MSEPMPQMKLREPDSLVDAEAVVDRALPVIDTVLRRRCHDAGGGRTTLEDLRAEIVVRILARLRGMADEAGRPIEDLDAYVAGIASRVIDDSIRATHPEWTHLKHRVRYLATHDDRFRVTIEGDARVIRSSTGRRSPAVRIRTVAAERLAADIVAVLREAGGQLPLDDVVSAIAEQRGLTEPVAVPEDRFALASAHPPGASIDAAEILRCLWSEIVALPLRQRMALLLSARDATGETVLRLLAATELVSNEAIAAALEMNADELAHVVQQAPLSDAVIAERLGVKVQQVINLRKAARDRLARRIGRAR